MDLHGFLQKNRIRFDALRVRHMNNRTLVYSTDKVIHVDVKQFIKSVSERAKVDYQGYMDFYEQHGYGDISRIEAVGLAFEYAVKLLGLEGEDD